jgi:ankyrin repeat protein
MPADPDATEPLRAIDRAFRADAAAEVGRLLAAHPELRARINDPITDFDSPAIVHVKSRAMLDVLLAAGADINARSRWWAGGFGLIDCASPDLSAYAIERGAAVTVHAAARLGLFDQLRALLDADASLVHARGGDGQTPLHFASSVEIARFLLDRGADIDARDVDHESTAAQYMVKSRPTVARYLIERGCVTDILLAAALGERRLVDAHLARDPESIRTRVTEEFFPMIGGKSGGTIYQWELGWYVSAAQVARKFGHPALFAFLMDRSPADERLLNACWLGDESLVRSILAERPNIAGELTPGVRRHLAHAARNNDTTAVRLMLLAGLPVDGRSQHGATALHWAAWQGNAEAVRLILERRPPLEDASNAFEGTPLSWAIHGSENTWHPEKGDFPATVRFLLDAGATPPATIGGTEAVRQVLMERRS